jgi:nicotinamide mononucleotide transporter
MTLWAEIFSSLLGIISIWLNTRRNVTAWPIGLISVSLAAFVYAKSGLWAETGLQGFFFVSGMYGWMQWARNREGSITTKVSPLIPSAMWISIVLCLLLFVILVWLVHKIPGSSLPWLDALIASVSVLGQIWLAWRWKENWIVWILVNVLSVGVYVWKELWVFTGYYSLLLILAIQGWKSWNQKICTKDGI